MSDQETPRQAAERRVAAHLERGEYLGAISPYAGAGGTGRPTDAPADNQGLEATLAFHDAYAARQMVDPGNIPQNTQLRDVPADGSARRIGGMSNAFAERLASDPSVRLTSLVDGNPADIATAHGSIRQPDPSPVIETSRDPLA